MQVLQAGPPKGVAPEEGPQRLLLPPYHGKQKFVSHRLTVYRACNLHKSVTDVLKLARH